MKHHQEARYNMNAYENQKPIVCIDLKKNRIRIHKTTLHMIGDPSFINLLVNPKEKLIAIKKSSAKDKSALRIRSNQLNDGNCVEFGCRDLILLLKDIDNSWQINSSYRIYGKYNKGECLAQFSIKDSIPTEEI
ncbi:hypothetical protein ACGCUP_03910 [Eubacteriales bacterium KG125]